MIFGFRRGCKGDLESFEIFRSEKWYFLTDVSGEFIGLLTLGRWPRCCPETLGRDDHATLRKIPKQRRSEKNWAKNQECFLSCENIPRLYISQKETTRCNRV